MNQKSTIFILLAIFHIATAFGQMTQQDTMYVFRSAEPIIIDGKADDPAWADAEWFPIDQVWIPYNATMAPGDFEGRFKLSWDENYLYVLAEIVDDMLSDDHANPLQNWWQDDCLEVFIDENRSKGDHERNYNAFAYHVSLFYDAIDLHTNGNPINLKNNLKVVMDTLENNTYMWELAIKNYSAAFNYSNPEASRVFLHHDKLMGFVMAYCDNDQTTTRENFIGSIYMAQAVANDNYKTADYFGTVLLVDPNHQNVSVDEIWQSPFVVYPNPASDFIIIENAENALLEIFSPDGRLIRSVKIETGNNSIKISDIPSGMYIIHLTDEKQKYSQMIVKR
jgi:hypothetical protein